MSLKVAVRLRPFNQREKDRNETDTIIDMVSLYKIKYNKYINKH